MDGVMIVRALLVADAAVLALVPAERIVGGDIPQGVPLPAISIHEVSAVRTGVIGGKVAGALSRARIQVSPNCKTYGAVKQLRRAIDRACSGQSGQIAGVKVSAVLFDSVGPDFSDDAKEISAQPIDFIVTYTEPS